MLCAPPMCAPATHFLGRYSLRTGALVMLGLNVFYGLQMTLVHAMLLGTIDEPVTEQLTWESMTVEKEEERRLLEHAGWAGAAPPQAAAGAGQFTAQSRPPPEGAPHVRRSSQWWLQVMDLDIGFGHQLFGLPDQANLICGLLYGILVTLMSLYTIWAITGQAQNLSTTARLFTTFAHLEILVYVSISLVKLPKLCRVIQKQYLTHLQMECQVLWYFYVWQTASILAAMSLGTWVFASYSFVLTFGHNAHSAVDHPDFAKAVEHPNPAAGARGGPAGPERGPDPYTSHSRLAPPPSRSSLVGHPVQSSGYGPGYGPASRYPQPPPRHPAAGGHPAAASYNVGRMPRATSSMATSTSAHSEHRPLIKPPVAVY